MKRRNFLTAILAAPAAVVIAKSIDKTPIPVPDVENCHTTIGLECINGVCTPIEGNCPKEYGYCVDCLPTSSSPYDLNWDKKVGFKMRVKKGHNKVLRFKPNK